MSVTICLCADTFDEPDLGGHRWVYLNWALGLRALGCRVIWLECVKPNIEDLPRCISALKSDLASAGFDGPVVFYPKEDRVRSDLEEPLLTPAMAAETDLLLNMAYDIPGALAAQFKRSGLIDIDPGMTQLWISRGQLTVPRHDVYFTIGETVGHPGSSFPDCGVEWRYTPPPVYLPAWTVAVAESGAPYTTLTNWSNAKRAGFKAVADVPLRASSMSFELAISYLDKVGKGPAWLCDRWRISNGCEVAGSADHYRRYIQQSRGEFSGAKPGYVKLRTAWISDRTLCYLASGKPAIVQHTGPSRFLPDADGLFRYRDADEAVRMLRAAEDDYDRHCQAGRALAEEYFDATKVLRRVLEIGLS